MPEFIAGGQGDGSMIGVKFSQEHMEAYRIAGVQRALCERDLLSLMFNGFSVISLDKNKYDYVCMIESVCRLDKYTNLIRADLDSGYSTLTNETKKYFHLMAGLDALVSNGLVKKDMWFSDDFSPEDGFKNLANKVDYTAASSVSWLARALVTSDNKDRSFVDDRERQQNDYPPIKYQLENIEYMLTTKGYDVAMKFIEHSDQEKRFNLQSVISEKSASAATSSAKTARYAIFAAFTIAFGSITNIVMTLMIHYGYL